MPEGDEEKPKAMVLPVMHFKRIPFSFVPTSASARAPAAPVADVQKVVPGNKGNLVLLKAILDFLVFLCFS